MIGLGTLPKCPWHKQLNILSRGEQPEGKQKYCKVCMHYFWPEEYGVENVSDQPVTPIETWMEAIDIKELLEAFVDHAMNAVDFHFSEFDKEEFKRHCAISLRQFIKENEFI